MGQEDGLYYSDGSFKSDKDIKREAALDLGSPLIIESHVEEPLNVFENLDNARQRAESMAYPNLGKVEAYIPNTSIIAIIGDVHLGHPNVDHDRVAREIQAISNTPDVFVILTGDLVDGIFWGGESGSEQTQTINEQQAFVRSLFKELRDRVIVAVSGEHDSKWASRAGADPYSQFSEITGSPYIRGVAEISLNVGEENYQIVAQHKAKGHSMYNKSHPTFRQARFHLQGADVYLSAHTHQKQISQESMRDTEGSHIVTHVNTGAYKTGDGYGERMGYVSQNSDDMFGAAIRLHADRKQVDVSHSILEAIRQWG